MTELNTSRNDIPNVSATGINDSAKMVWQAVQATKSFTSYSSPGKLQGIPGRYWQGSVNQVINDLWPALSDRYLTEKEQSDELKFALNRFLKYNRAMVCTRDGGVIKKSMWFVATHWPELTVTPGPHQGAKPEAESVVTDEAATSSPTTVGSSAVTPLDVFNLKRPAVAPAITTTEEKSEEAMTDTTPAFQEPDFVIDEDKETVEHKCRLETCNQKFAGIHHRAIHEMSHGFRINADGTVTDFDVNVPAPDEQGIQDLIVKVCEGQEPMTQAQIVEAVRKDTPKASAPMIKIIISVLLDDGWFEKSHDRVEGDNPKMYTRRLRFLGEPKRKTKKTKPITEAVEAKADTVVEESSFLATAVATLRGDADQSRMERYQDLINDLMNDLAQLDALKAELDHQKSLNANLQRDLDTVARELNDALAKASNNDELARVTAERDELQGKLNTLKQIFS